MSDRIEYEFRKVSRNGKNGLFVGVPDRVFGTILSALHERDPTKTYGEHRREFLKDLQYEQDEADRLMRVCLTPAEGQAGRPMVDRKLTAAARVFSAMHNLIEPDQKDPRLDIGVSSKISAVLYIMRATISWPIPRMHEGPLALFAVNEMNTAASIITDAKIGKQPYSIDASVVRIQGVRLRATELAVLATDEQTYVPAAPQMNLRAGMITNLGQFFVLATGAASIACGRELAEM